MPCQIRVTPARVMPPALGSASSPKVVIESSSETTRMRRSGSGTAGSRGTDGINRNGRPRAGAGEASDGGYPAMPVGNVYEAIDERLQAWIERQSLFFVGTAPASLDGHVNVSPKGPIGALRVLDPLTVAYLDIVGSGAETIAHLRENGRIVIMLCAFQGPPRILRLHGEGEVLTPADPRFDETLRK